MAIGHLSIRINTGRRHHHLYRNNGGMFWVHFTLHFEGRKRRIRRSLRTRDLERAIQLRDELFAHIRDHGEPVPPRRKSPERRSRLLSLTGDQHVSLYSQLRTNA